MTVGVVREEVGEEQMAEETLVGEPQEQAMEIAVLKDIVARVPGQNICKRHGISRSHLLEIEADLKAALGASTREELVKEAVERGYSSATKVEHLIEVGEDEAGFSDLPDGEPYSRPVTKNLAELLEYAEGIAASEGLPVEAVRQAMEATAEDALTVLTLTFLDAGLLVGLVALLISILPSDLAIVASLVVVGALGALGLSLLFAWMTLRHPFAQDELNMPTGELRDGYYKWIVNRAKHGFWKGLAIQAGWGLVVIVGALLLVAIRALVQNGVSGG
jgi:hypothetical protein